MHAIGDKIWTRGDEATVVSEPYEKYGVEWFDVTIDATGKRVALPTPEAKAAQVAKTQAEWKQSQAEFRRLKTR